MIAIQRKTRSDERVDSAHGQAGSLCVSGSRHLKRTAQVFAATVGFKVGFANSGHGIDTEVTGFGDEALSSQAA